MTLLHQFYAILIISTIYNANDKPEYAKPFHWLATFVLIAHIAFLLMEELL